MAHNLARFHPTATTHALSTLILILLAGSVLAPSPTHAEVRDGKLFDAGIELRAPADAAAEDLARLAAWIGDWDLTQEVYRPDQVLTATGRARITYMNRGHAVMERTRIADYDGAGHAMATLAFLDVSQGVWTVGEGNSWTESITLWSGGWQGDEPAVLVVHDAIRPGGGPLLMLMRRTYRSQGADAFEMLQEISTDVGQSWQPNVRRTYRRHSTEGSMDADDDFFPVRDDVGLPSPERIPEATEFDFLLGVFDASHWQRPPQGPARRRQSTGTAVYVLDGKAILEFDWFDGDPSLPDAATSILRIYNTSMRRWESLFLPNRTHRPLFFGGVREDDRIVLHLFDAQTGPGSVFQWIFFDIREDSYRWKGLSSPDRGSTYEPLWTIDFVRRGTELPPAEVTPARTRSSDGTVLYGDHYRAAAPAATTVVLFHQAGGDARGEYGEIARRLQAEGHEVFAWDARGGGDRFGSPNRTVAALAEPFEGGYCDAYPDLEAGLRYAFLQGSGGPLFVVGSSYSAALAVRLAAEHGNLLSGAVAFSPAPGSMGSCAVTTWLPKVDGTPLLVLRPRSETENEAVAAQTALLEAGGVEVFVGPGAHGASMLHAGRSGDVGATWERLKAFLANPANGD